ncbi:MAG TPA: response regulator [Verrucomicrobiae bacterium]|nr:response regulator [Verrucomicrobiae bacterium]
MTAVPRDTLIYLAIRQSEDRSHIEDTLVLDGFRVRSFPSAESLWPVFQQHPARIVITDRRFRDSMSGLELAQNIRRDYLMPYCYIVLRSAMNHLPEIEEGLASGADDYLIKPHNPVELRARILVGLRWLTYIDQLVQEQSAPG